MTYADIRKTDPAIKAIIQLAASVNIQKLEIDQIEKILVEGADGRYLKDVHTEYQVSYSADGNYHIPNHVGDTVKILYNCPRQCCDIVGEHSHEVTIDDIDKAMASIPEPKTFADYGKTYRVLPGGGFEEIK